MAKKDRVCHPESLVGHRFAVPFAVQFKYKVERRSGALVPMLMVAVFAFLVLR
jgi:hypothetical protein